MTACMMYRRVWAIIGSLNIHALSRASWGIEVRVLLGVANSNEFNQYSTRCAIYVRLDAVTIDQECAAEENTALCK